MATQIPATKKGVVGQATERLDNAITWWTFGGILWGAFTTAARNSDWLGRVSWADSFIVGALLSVIVMLGLSGTLALWRQFNPTIDAFEAKRRAVIGSRGVFTKFDTQKGVTFRQLIERDASYQLLRPYLRAEFLRNLTSGQYDGEDALRQGDFCLLARDLAAEIDYLARKWRIHG